MRLGGQNFRHQVRNIVAGGDKLKTDELIRNLLAQPRHLHAEVTVAPGNNMVVDHRHARLVVFIQKGRGVLLETQLLEKIAQPEDILGCICSGHVLGLSSAEADHP